MAKGISLYPQLNDEILNKIRFDLGEYEFFYTQENIDNDLTLEHVEGSDSVFKLVDKRSLWDVNNYNIGVRKSIDCRTCSNLFGNGGVACKNATIGVAMMWMSADSRQRGTINLGEIKNTLESQCVKSENVFNIGQLRGNVQFDIVLYIKEAAKEVLEDEQQLANETGFLLGSIGDSLVIQLDGSGSVFPIYEESKPGRPLWRVECNWENPSEEMFDEAVRIVLNKSHSSYQYIDRNNKQYVPQMLREIMASAITVIIETFKNDEDAWYTVEDESNVRNGSLSEAIIYFRNTLGWDLDNVETISLSVREFFERNM